MDFSAAIDEIMPLVKDGDNDKPFIITRDSAYGDWQVCYPDPDKADGFAVSLREHDPFVAKYFGADFDRGSMPYVYDKVLCDRLRTEFYECRDEDFQTDADKERLHALINFFEDNVNSFTHTVTDYLTELEKPFRALEKMCPFNMATGHDGWTFNQDLAADAVDCIEKTAAERNRVKLETAKNEASTSEKANGYDSTHTISYIELFGYEIEIGEDTDHKLPYYVETTGRGDNDFSFRTDSYPAAIQAYSEQLANAAYEMRLDHEDKAVMHGVNHAVLTEAHCLPDSRNANYTGQLIIVDAKSLLPEYRASDSQLIQCTHGNGARPDAIGTSVFCKELYSGKTVVYGRHQILGIADENILPQWAKARLEILRDKSVFKYGDYHFKPYRKFDARDGDWNKKMSNASSDRSLGIAKYDWGKTEYSHASFYAASGESEADIFRCAENGRLYVPCENELFRYDEPPQKEKTAQKPAQPPQSKQPPTLLGEVREAAQLVEQRKAERGNAPATKKKDGLEV